MKNNNGTRFNSTKNIAMMAAAATMVLTAIPASVAAQATPPAPVFTMSPYRSRLVVLIHGITSEPWQARDEHIGETMHGRHYWGEDFIRGLMGTTDQSQMNVVQPMDTVDNTIAHYVNPLGSWNVNWSEYNNDGKTSGSTLAPIVIPRASGLWFPGTVIRNRTVILDTLSKQSVQSPNPSTSVMVTFRQGAKHLMPQVGQAVDQIYNTYMKTYGNLPVDRQPQLYLVGHSFGGIIARAIAANPTGGDLWGNKLTALQRQRADFIRQRTVLITTMGTPHNGTPTPDLTQDISRYLRTVENVWEAMFDDSDADGPPLFNLGIREAIEKKGKEMLGMALDEVTGERECLNDIIRINEYNQGILHPDTGRRTPGGSLIPIYTLGGRNPGNMFMDRDRGLDLGYIHQPYDVRSLMNGDRHAVSAIALHGLFSLLYEKGYGKEAKRPFGTAHVAEGDKVASPYEGFGPNSIRSLSTPLNLTTTNVAKVIYNVLDANPYRINVTDGEYDSDGFVGFDSAHALNLTGPQWYRLYPKAMYGGFLPWDIDNHGTMMFNVGNGLWLRNEIITKAGSQISSQDKRQSVFPMWSSPVTPKVNVTVEIAEITDILDNLDPGNGADFWVGARIGDQEFSAKGEDNQRVSNNLIKFTLNDFSSTVIPIRLSVAELDLGNAVDPHDPCAISPQSARDNVYIYLDTRTGRVHGDVQGTAGQVFSVEASDRITNCARLKFKVTFTQTAG